MFWNGDRPACGAHKDMPRVTFGGHEARFLTDYLIVKSKRGPLDFADPNLDRDPVIIFDFPSVSGVDLNDR